MAKVRTRKRGKTFSYIFEAGKGEDGKRKVIEKGGFPTKEAAYEAGAMAFTDWKHGNIGITSEKVTVKEFLQSWLENVARLNVRESSFRLYTKMAELRILPYIGGLIVQDLAPAVLDGYMRRLVQKGFARNTIAGTWRLLCQALDYAVYPAEIIQNNPAKYIKVPRSAPRGVVKRTVITKEMYENLMAQCPFGTPYHIPLAILYHTGMRIGEVLAICWDDVDLEQKTIHVERQCRYFAEQGHKLVPPKTSASVRDIKIGETLSDLLGRWKEQQASDELSCGDSYCVIDERDDHVLLVHSKGLREPSCRKRMVCTRRDGHPVWSAALTRFLCSIGLNAHSFRHSHATMLAESGAPLKGIAGRLGHSRIETTGNIYAHNTEKIQEMTAAIFESAMQTKR